ncbi:hypothetical protein BGZ80_002198 [Entomortierella chlamydospora]|uniref:DNA endonuclease activator Ctp1 C-terminal domain-containing protein n=1 Tax=Entomortierella chlamydospora TaxID=101097 RepID=A0A9P6SXT2_9FUNG|nr:hypothetical protein BGZ80_002198 [Entomortierella chlamydospora]
MRSRSLPPVPADVTHGPDELNSRPMQHRHENDDHDNVFISTTSAATTTAATPTLKIKTQSKRPSAIDATPGLMGPQLQECLAQAAQCAQDLQDRYQGSSSSSKGPVTGPSKQNDGDVCNESFSSFVSQSISQILDYMAPSNGSKEPKLPPLSKGSYSVANSTTSRDGGETEHTLRSALKSSSKSRPCTCGCQEEIKAWKARCDFAENQATLLEMRCEKTNIMMDAYKAKWTQWKETVVREQYQRRMKAAMSPQSARYMSLSSSKNQSQQQQQQQQQQQPQQNQQGQQGRRKKVFFTSDNTRRVRLGTEESNSSQKRQEVTERNTLFNQLITRVPEVSTTVRSSTPTNRALQTGTNSVSSPHVAFDDKDDNISSSNDDDATEEPVQRKPITYVLDSEENDTSVDYGEQPMSLTFPSDLALRRRGQGFSELEENDDDDDDDEDDGLDSSGREENRGFESSSRAQSKRRQYIDDSPTTRITERNQRRTAAISHRENLRRQQSPCTTDLCKVDDENTAGMLSIASDRSSPPMFDSEDYVTLYRSRKTSVKQDSDSAHTSLPHTPKSTSRNIQQDGSADRGRVFVPETPLELQGITPKKENEILTQSPLKPTSTHPNAVQQTSIPGGNLPNPMREATTNETESALHQYIQSQSPGGADESDKENKAPQVQAQVHEIHSSSDLEVYEKEDSFVEEGTCQGQGQGQRRSGEINHPKGRLQKQEQLRAQQAAIDVPEERIYNFTERRKDKRKQMHGHDCACCRRFYELTGPLPLPDGYNAFFTPAPRPGEKEVWEKSAEEKLQDRIQQISRHRVQHEEPLTPPGFWDTDFPSTQERIEWDKIAAERRERKKQRMEHQLQKQQQLQQQKRRRQ